MNPRNTKVSISDGVAVLKISRPEVRNALDSRTLREIHTAMVNLSGNSEAKVVIVTGEGSAFAAGADLSELRGLDCDGAERYASLGQDMLRCVEQMDRPVLAAINGHCLGGGLELALACDLRVCSRDARMGQPGLGLGVIPGFAGTRRLTRLAGPGRAKELVFLGEPIDAEKALEIGLVNWVVEPDRVLSFSMEIAMKLKTRAPFALRTVKALMNAENAERISTSGKAEIEAFYRTFQTEEPRVGIDAFFDKTKPNW